MSPESEILQVLAGLSPTIPQAISADLFSFAICVFVVGSIFTQLRYWFHGGRYEDTKILFQQLSKVHGLSVRERKTLWDAAKRWKLENPSLLFVDGSLWQLPNAPDPFTPPPRVSTPSERTLSALRSRLLRWVD